MDLGRVRRITQRTSDALPTLRRASQPVRRHHGALVERPHADLGPADVSSFKVGYVPGAWGDEDRERELLFSLRALGVEVSPVELPDYPMRDLIIILNAEAAAAFDELTRSGRDDELVRQGQSAWPNAFREARLIPAVEYINANRIRRLLTRDWVELFDRIDLLVHPSQHGMILGATT